ncbi:MAG: hypothetical protein V4760_12670 [Bdellovibrionota bacterium]
MSLGTKPDKFKAPPGESPIEALVYKKVCDLDGLDMSVERIREYWSSREPWAGKGTQVTWLAGDLERASRLVCGIAPHCRVGTAGDANEKLRSIIVFESESLPQAMRMGVSVANDPIIISAGSPAEFDGRVLVGCFSEGVASFVDLFVIGSFVQAAAAAAGVVSALVSKATNISAAEVQKVLIANASRTLGYPALRRV